MEPEDVARGIEAAVSIARTLGLQAEDATILQNSNKLALRLLPCDTFARVAPVEHRHARFEVPLARRLAEVGGPVAVPEPRVAPRGYEYDGFDVSFWTSYETVAQVVDPAAYAGALDRLHAAMRLLDVLTPHFTDRVHEAERVLTSPAGAPDLADADRLLILGTLRRRRDVIADHEAPEQLLHGEPHAGNVLATTNGPVFIDLETCCRGPVEFDLAHVPQAVEERYPVVDHDLLDDCRELVLAMVAAWRWEPDDQFPRGRAFGEELLRSLRAGPPWPSIDVVHDRLGPP